MGKNLDAPAPSSDASIQEAPVAQGRALVEFPTTEKDKKDWQSNLTSMRESGFNESIEGILPKFELSGIGKDFGDLTVAGGADSGSSQDVDGDGIPDNPGEPTSTEKQSASSQDVDGDGIPDNPLGPTSSELKQEVAKDVDGDGIPDDPGGPSSSELKQLVSSVDTHGEAIDDNPNLPAAAVLEQLTKLQQQQQDFEDPAKNAALHGGNHAGEDTGEDTGSTAVLANNLSFGFHANVDRVNSERKEKLAESEAGGIESSEIVEGKDKLTNLNSQELAARAFAGEAAVGPPPSGVDQISIYDLKMRKENDGQVVLLAPRSDGSYSDGVPLVRNDGRPVSAMELGQYLRPDGTILMGEQGRAYRPGDTFAATTPAMSSNGIGLDSNFVERSLMLDKIELSDASNNLASGKLEAREKFANLRESKSEARAQENIVSNAGDSTQNKKNELTFEPKEAAEQQRSVKIWRGETLRSVALRDLGDVKNWQALAEKNNLSTETNSNGTPVAALERGTVLMLPTTSEIENFQARASLAASLQLT